MTAAGASPERRIRFGLIGLGLAGGSLMAPAMAEHPCAEIAAAADLRADLRQRFTRDFGVPAFESVEELCRRDDIDAVYIATPHQLHREHAIVAARSGKHVIVEKPLALTLDDCDAIIATVESAGVQLIVGHTHGYDPAVRTMRRIIASGALGRVAMINTWNYSDFLYRPRRPEELDTAQGGGIMFNQVPHQVDMVRMLGGGLVRSARAVTTRLDPARPTEGGCVAILEFEDGAGASLAYSGYDRFDSDELHGWIGEGGRPKLPGGQGRTRRALLKGVSTPGEEAALRAARYGYGSPSWAAIAKADGPGHQPHFGLLIVSCEKGDMRPSADGIYIYDEDGVREVPIERGRGRPGQGDVIDELYDAVVSKARPFHDARWGKATLEVCLVLLQSSRERRELALAHQVAAPPL
jgi:phthalate 4,5-cis-dihydrodiol dehydrogenase